MKYFKKITEEEIVSAFSEKYVDFCGDGVRNVSLNEEIEEQIINLVAERKRDFIPHFCEDVFKNGVEEKYPRLELWGIYKYDDIYVVIWYGNLYSHEYKQYRYQVYRILTSSVRHEIKKFKRLRDSNWKYTLYLDNRASCGRPADTFLVRHGITPKGKGSKYWVTLRINGAYIPHPTEEELTEFANQMRLPKLPKGYTWSEVYLY